MNDIKGQAFIANWPMLCMYTRSSAANNILSPPPPDLTPHTGAGLINTRWHASVYYSAILLFFRLSSATYTTASEMNEFKQSNSVNISEEKSAIYQPELRLITSDISCDVIGLHI